MSSVFESLQRAITRTPMSMTIGLLSLVLGFVALIATHVVTSYEASYDRFFAAHENIYAIATDYQPDSGAGVRNIDSAYGAVAPLLAGSTPSLLGTARSRLRDVTIEVGDTSYRERLRFVDPEFFGIFEFDLVEGSIDGRGLQPGEAVVTFETAERLFPTANAVGRRISLPEADELRVVAVVETLPHNSHFTTSLLPKTLNDPKFGIIAPLESLSRLTGSDPDTHWDGTSPTDVTYVRLRDGADAEAVNTRLDAIYAEHAPDRVKTEASGFRLRPLAELNAYLWNATGIPAPAVLKGLGVVVFVVAAFNFAVMSNAIGLGRVREIGIRRLVGAGRQQIGRSLFLEALCLVVLSLIIALGLSVLLLHGLGNAFGRSYTLFGHGWQARAGLAALLVPAIAVVGGVVPIRRAIGAAVIDNLHASRKGIGRNRSRDVLVGVQLFATVVLASVASVIVLQNQHMKDEAFVEDMDSVFVVERLGTLDAITRTLFTNVARDNASVSDVSLLSQPPFVQGKRTVSYSRSTAAQERPNTFLKLSGDHRQTEIFDIEIVAGRAFDTELDPLAVPGATKRLVLSEKAASRLGFESPEAAIGVALYDGTGRAAEVVGVAEDVNYLGFHNGLLPIAFELDISDAGYLVARTRDGQRDAAIAGLRTSLKEVSPDTPFVGRRLRSYFNELFGIFSGLGAGIVPFAVVGILLAFIGLVALTAFTTARRSHEVAVRKTYGAGEGDIVRLFLKQLMAPVAAALCLGLGVSLVASRVYLGFFADPVTAVGLVIAMVGAGVVAVSLASVMVQVVKSARAHPAKVLREL